jgi:hypothetical protein
LVPATATQQCLSIDYLLELLFPANNTKPDPIAAIASKSLPPQPKAKNARYIVRFKDAQPLSVATSLCNELKGKLPAGTSQRFRGSCESTFFKV